MSFKPLGPFSAADDDDALTSQEHHNDCENHFIVSDGGDVAKADGAEPGKDKVQGGAVAALWMERGHVVHDTTWREGKKGETRDRSGRSEQLCKSVRCEL